MRIHSAWFGVLLNVTCLVGCAADSDSGAALFESTAALSASAATPPRGRVQSFAQLDAIPAGIAVDRKVVFVGSPLEARVQVLSRRTGASVGELPAPPNGFVLPFIMHSIGAGKLAVLDAGGLPSPKPLVPANPTIYEYSFSYSEQHGFSATLTRSISFASVLVGFAEDFVALGGGRYLLSDAILGSIWIANADGTISPGIVPKTFDPSDGIPQLMLCPTMPETVVNGVPFLFSGSTLPGVSPLAYRNGKVFFFSPCARGTFSVPLASLFDKRKPYARAADIRLVGSTPADYQVEELLDFSFNPNDPSDPYLYAADPLQLQIIRQDSRTGARQILARDPRLLDFPSALAFAPSEPGDCDTSLYIVSNQQERTPLTNDAVTEDSFELPFIVANVRVAR